MMWKKLNSSICYLDLSCTGHVTLHVSVMFNRWCNVKPHGAMILPGGLLLQLIMDNHFGPGRSHWVAIEIILPMDICIC